MTEVAAAATAAEIGAAIGATAGAMIGGTGGTTGATGSEGTAPRAEIKVATIKTRTESDRVCVLHQKTVFIIVFRIQNATSF